MAEIRPQQLDASAATVTTAVTVLPAQHHAGAAYKDCCTLSGVAHGSTLMHDWNPSIDSTFAATAYTEQDL